MKSDDELLDEIAAHLRSAPVPPMPDVVPGQNDHVPQPSREQPPATAATIPSGSENKRPESLAARRWPWAAIAAAALAASIAGLTWWRELPPAPRVDKPAVNVAESDPKVPPASEVVLVNVDLTEPLSQLESRLDALDAEIVELRREAGLVSARRKAEMLLAQWP